MENINSIPELPDGTYLILIKDNQLQWYQQVALEETPNEQE